MEIIMLEKILMNLKKVNPKVDNWNCYIIGHSFKEGWNDSGYLICDRCEMCEYYDYDDDATPTLKMTDYPFWGKWAIVWFYHQKLVPFLFVVKSWDRTRYWFWYKSKLGTLLDYKFGFGYCDNCLKKSRHKDWKGDVCPICGESNLPF